MAVALATRSRTLKDEDRACAHAHDVCGEAVLFLLVADGHGGHQAAGVCAELALPYLVREASDLGDASGASLREALARTFEWLHAHTVREVSKTAGATLTIVAWNAARGELTCANAGDSAALLVCEAGRPESFRVLTAEHRLSDSADERERILAAGFKLGRAMMASGEPGGPVRCWPGGLAVCRTIGDADCGAACSAVPALSTTPLAVAAAQDGAEQSTSFSTASGFAVVLCSDGVWDALDHEKARS